MAEKFRQEKVGLKSLFIQFGYTPTPSDRISTMSKHKLENIKGCDWLTEVSITVRRCRKTSVTRDRQV